MGRTGRSFTEHLKDYLGRITPAERAIFDKASLHFAEENRRICQHRDWYTTDPPTCVRCGLVGKVD